MPFPALGVTITFAPNMRMIFLRSTENGSAMQITHLYPRCAHAIATAIPVFPLVASTTVSPGLSAPLRSASVMTATANRSLTLDSGLKYSALTYISTPSGAVRLILITGVSPTVSRIFS